VSPYQAEQLKTDAEWKEAQKMANNRGAENALFTGEIGYIDEAIVVQDQAWSTEYAGIINSGVNTDGYFDPKISISPMSIYAGATSKTTDVALLLGATALGITYSEELKLYTDKTIDMGRKVAIGVDRLLGVAKSKYIGITETEKASRYHGKDLSVIAVVSRQI
jgi:hypothetical protein